MCDNVVVLHVMSYVVNMHVVDEYDACGVKCTVEIVCGGVIIYSIVC